MAKLIRTDFLLNKNGDFPLQDTVINGKYIDTPFGNSDQQHVFDIIQYNLGYLKGSPTTGFGVNNYLNSENGAVQAENNLKMQLSEDDYELQNGAINQVGGGFTINTQYIVRK